MKRMLTALLAAMLLISTASAFDKLRDLAALLDFDVDWSVERGISVETT